MTGERLAWYRVAAHLRMPVAELQHRLTYTEFLEWLYYLDWERRQHSKLDHYLAQVAAEVRRTAVKHPRTVKTKDFLFQPAEPAAQQPSKSVWLAALHVKPKKKADGL